MRKLFILTGLLVVLVTASVLYRDATTQSGYEGLPTVPCLDDTKPIAQNFSFMIKITINGQNFPLDANIGHDYGNCLHEIYVNDSSGKVFIKANDNEVFTLGQFFDVWHKTFSQNQIFGYQVGQGHSLAVTIDGKPVNTFQNTPLTSNGVIQIVYK